MFNKPFVMLLTFFQSQFIKKVINAMAYVIGGILGYFGNLFIDLRNMTSIIKRKIAPAPYAMTIPNDILFLLKI